LLAQTPPEEASGVLKHPVSKRLGIPRSSFVPGWFIPVLLWLIWMIQLSTPGPLRPQHPRWAGFMEGGGTADWDAGAVPGAGTDPDSGFGDKNRSSRARTAAPTLNCQFLISWFAL